MQFISDNIEFGDRRLIGQQTVKQQIEKILKSDRLGHAYLITGPLGIGKTAFALALAEVVNGIDNLTDLKGTAVSKKSSWFNHPDIHVFIPLPTTIADSETAKVEELKSRLQMLQKDPYEIVDFSLRPVIDDASSSKNLKAFYPIDYFRDDIRTKAFLKPNEGRRTIIVITGIETMRREAANTFLKLLEEPPPNLMFLLTANNTDQLLPTILSRCSLLPMKPLSTAEITGALVQYDQYKEEDATFLARISGGNYALTRFFDLELQQQIRSGIIDFLRLAYTQDVKPLLKLIQDWQSSLNRENQLALMNSLEMLIRDMMIYRETQSMDLIVNADQADVIKKFCQSLGDAKLDQMIEQVNSMKPFLIQNVQFKFIFTVLALRFFYMMRGKPIIIEDDQEWKHLPAVEGAY
jgi:DNA polymerase-3 subunit delta'